MLIYLSLKQLILNQIAVLLRKHSDKSNDDPVRLEKRLKYLQDALEQIKSYDHNKNYKHVIRHFHQGLGAPEQEELNDIARQHNDLLDPHSRQVSKSGFTTTRSETLFTGAAEDVYPLGQDHDDEKHARHNDHHRRGPLWIHYKGFANWLRKQSFIKFKKRKDEEKYKQIWEHMLGIKLIKKWDKGGITKRNLIGPFPSETPYINIFEKTGNKEIVKASLLRLSIVQNRIFKFDVDLEETVSRHSRSRRSVDMDNEEDQGPDDAITANELITEKNLFNRVQNKDVLRIVATILFDKGLANNVLEELIQNPRFSMCGDYGKSIAKQLMKEFPKELKDMNFQHDAHSVQSTPTQRVQSNGHRHPQSVPREEPVAQFPLPSPSGTRSKGSGSARGQVQTANVYSPQFTSPPTNDHSDYSSYPYKSSGSTMSPSPQHHGYHHHHHLAQQGDAISSPSLSPNEVIPKHKGHSDSVVYHDSSLHHKNFSEIGYGDDHDGDEEESHSDQEIPFNH